MNLHSTLHIPTGGPLVLIATDCWEQTNGITTLYRAVIRSLDEHFHGHCRLLVVHPSDRASDQSLGDHRVVGIAPRFRFHLPQYPELVTGYVRQRDFRKLEATHGTVDVVHVATQGLLGLSAMRYAVKYRKPCVGFYHTNWPAYVGEYLPAMMASRLTRSFARVLAGWWDRMIYRHCSLLVAHTARTDEGLGTVLKRNLVYTSAFVDGGRFAMRGAMPGGHRHADPVVFGFVGRIAREKSLPRILNHADTIKRLGCRLIVVGDGPERVRFDPSSAEFVGCKYGSDLAAIYRAMHFLLLPARSDTLGLVLLEAAAWGTPAVALRGTAAADLVCRYGAGVVVDDFDGALFERLQSLAQSDEFIDMKARATSMAAEHDISVGTRVLLNVWLDACPGVRQGQGDVVATA